jgi:hypothetical protein
MLKDEQGRALEMGYLSLRGIWRDIPFLGPWREEIKYFI